MKKRVVIQGVTGAFHEIAARKYFQESVIEIVPAGTFEELIQVVENENNVGIMAIENSIAGSLQQNYTLINNSALRITGEIYLRIKQNLLVLPGVSMEQLDEVHSHYMAIAQCQKFFNAYPQIKLVKTQDTAESARAIARKNLRNVGAIASQLAGELYDLEIRKAGIETNKKNYTRFFILEQISEIQHGRPFNKVSLSFKVKHEVGGLFQALSVLQQAGVNLTKIQSRPIPGSPWEYLFFVDFEIGLLTEFDVLEKQLNTTCHEVKVLGKYKKGEHHED